MRVSELMTPYVRTVPPSMSAGGAWALMKRERIHHLIVVDGGSPVGIFSGGNVGSSNINKGASVYAIGGVDLNFLLKSKLSTGGDDLTDQFERADYGFVVGLGVEVSRAIVEARYTKGVANIAKDKNDPELKGQAFAVMVGVRLN